MSPINCYFLFFVILSVDFSFPTDSSTLNTPSVSPRNSYSKVCFWMFLISFFIHFNRCRREESKCKISWFFEFYIYFKIPCSRIRTNQKLFSNRQLHFEYSFRIATQFILKSLLLDVFNLFFYPFQQMSERGV